MQHIYLEYNKKDGEVPEIIKRIIVERMLTAIPLYTCNSAVSIEFWKVFQKFPYDVRYRCYIKQFGEDYFSHPLKMLSMKRSILQIR